MHVLYMVIYNILSFNTNIHVVYEFFKFHESYNHIFISFAFSVMYIFYSIFKFNFICDLCPFHTMVYVSVEYLECTIYIIASLLYQLT